MARLLSVNVGLPRNIQSKGRTVYTGIWIRTNEPQMPALLTSSGRPGFYFRVLQEGEVGAADEVVMVGEAKEINALLCCSRPAGNVVIDL
jgi:MOSC domain-containing protein YiiM